MSIDVLKIIRRPLITEKNTSHLGTNVYSFEVDKRAGKHQIAKAVQTAFHVNVVDVRTMNCRGRRRRVGRTLSGVDRYKKALVRIAEGQKIKIFEGA